MVIRAGPLSGIRVIDFGHYTAGPLCGMLLADQGADVVKVDRPDCPQYQTPQSAVFNRNKQRVELNLKSPSDLEKARELVATADVVIENFRPGVMQRLGLDAATLTQRNTGLIYLSMPGFASTDTDYASIRAYEGVIAAVTGLYTDLQELRRVLGGQPVYTCIPVASTYGALHGATAVTLALYRREESGIGEQIEVPLAAAALSALAIINMQIEGKPSRYDAPALTEGETAQLPEWRRQVDHLGDVAIREIAGRLVDQNQPTTANYKAADGHWLYFVGSGHGLNTRKILQTLGIYEELISTGMVDVPVYENLNLSNNIADGPGWSREWNKHVRVQIQQKISQRSASDWEQALIANGVPATVHRSSRAWLNAPETRQAALIVEVDNPMFGAMSQIGIQTTLSSTPEKQLFPETCRNVPVEELLAARPRVSTPPQSHTDSSSILEGIRVLDLSNVLAGPVAGRTLAEFGADVIKIDPPDPNFGPRISCMFPIESSPGKRSLILDVKSQRGQEIFYDLVKTADVVINNFRPGVPDRMGIDYDSLKRIKPDLVYLNISAFDGPRRGPWADRAGFDPVLQAATGIQQRYGGDDSPPLYHGWASCIDYITGFSGTFGVAMSLLRSKRQRGNYSGDLVRTSLAQGAQLVQAPLLIGTKDVQPGAETRGQNAVGEHALYRFYRACDGWVFIAALEAELKVLETVPEFKDIGELALNTDDESQRYLERKLLHKSVLHWVRVFEAKGITATRVQSLDDIRNRYIHEGTTKELRSLWNDGCTLSWVRFTDHPVGGAVELSPPAYARFSNTGPKLLSPTPKQGANTREILLELGHSPQSIEELLKDQIVKDQLHVSYLPA